MPVDIPASLSGEFELQRVQFFEISAKIVETDSGLDIATEPSSSEGDAIEVHVSVRNEQSRVGCRVSADFATERLVARVDCAAFFRKLESTPGEMSDEDMRNVSEEALVVLVPYIREAMAEATRRVTGKPVVLGTVRMKDLLQPTDQ